MAAVSPLRGFTRLASGITRRHCGFFRKSVTSTRNAALLIALPPLSYLGYKTLWRASCATAVFALDKAEEIVEQADYLYSCGETEKLYQLLLQYKDSDDAEFLWRLARSSRDLALLPNIAADQKKKLIYDAFNYANKALEKNEACFAAHKWYAVCISDLGDYEGIKVKIGNSLIIKEHLERALELNPKDATSFHILGHWCFAFAELPWYQRKVAAVLFASPPTSTYEEALAFFLRAEEVDPNFYSKNLLMLGKTYMMLKNPEKALLWLNKARDYPVVTEEDKQSLVSRDGAVPKPGDAAAQDALNGPSVERGQDGGREMRFPQRSQEVEMLLGFLGDGAGV